MRGLVLPCSRCEPCRRKRRSETVTRLLTEGLAHSAISMVTLTYRPRDLPAGGSLVPQDVTSALWRLRSGYRAAVLRDPRNASLSPPELARLSRLRVFTVGEYGGRFGRPHYHLILFGADRSTVVDGKPLLQLLHDAWRKGSVHLGSSWSAKAAGYMAAYVAKGHNFKDHPALAGRHPEFSRWPNGSAGGLGVPGLSKLFPALVGGLGRKAALADTLPSRAELAGSTRFLGAFLLDRLRLAAGLAQPELRALKAKRSWLRSWELVHGSLPPLARDLLSTMFDRLPTARPWRSRLHMELCARLQ